MLLSFSVSNFRSFCEKQTLSMVASNRHTDHQDHLTAIPDDDNKALPVAALYGANGAGKSNLVKALKLLQDLVLKGIEPGRRIDRSAFVLDRQSKTLPTEIEVQFVTEGKAYVYGAKFLDDIVEEEWLSELHKGGERSVFKRTTDRSSHTDVDRARTKSENQDKLQALTTVGVPPNQLFLHAVRRNLSPPDQGPIFSAVLDWFDKRLVVINPSSMFTDLPGALAEDESLSAFASEFLRKVATGIDRLRPETTVVDEKLLSRPIPKELIGTLRADQTLTIHGQDEVTVEKASEGKLLLGDVKSEHVTREGERVDIPLSEESDGTRRLLHLLPALHAQKQKTGRVFVVDEIDRSLHPLLAKGFVRAFVKECAGHEGQIIFTTHDTSFLDLDLLRRDEIWFAEKKLPAGATELYSLSDFKVRTDLKIDKAYLQGRFEAIPPVEVEVPDWVRQTISELRPSSHQKKAEK
jgi:AAA15 family ATPase/GTPase